MLRKLRLFSMTALIAVMTVVTVKADIVQQENSDRSSGYDQIKIDRYLDVEVWTNRSDNEFYEGDNIVLSFRANRDAFVAIYTVDSRGRVNLLFPSSQDENNFIEGGETYRLPDNQDDFDFVVSGPEGVETVQIIASKERFPIPDWYPNSGIINDWDDRHEFMDYINGRYFVRYNGQRFAFDRASVYVNEWEDDYYRPVYYPSYPSWTIASNVYIDYPFGASVYVNGIYWGIAPLYIPRIYVGWHTVTLYDHYGHCWENDIHVTRYNTVVLDRRIIQTSPKIRSKYKEVRSAGYRNPVKHGYPKYKDTKVFNSKKVVNNATKIVNTKKKYVRGSTEVVKTKRGYETTGRTTIKNKRSVTRNNTYEKSQRRDNGSSIRTVDRTSTSSGTYKRSSGKTTRSPKSSVGSSSSSQKRSGKKSSAKVQKSSKQPSEKAAKVQKSSKKESNSSDYKKSDNSSKKSKSSGSVKKSSAKKSSSGKSGKKKR